MKTKNIISFEKLSRADLELVGSKNALLGDMIQNLASQGIAIPSGFSITVNAYKRFIDYNRFSNRIGQLINSTDVDDINRLNQTGFQIRKLIINGKFPVGLKIEIRKAYFQLSKKYNVGDIDVAVRSSLVIKKNQSLLGLGKQNNYLNIRGAESLLNSIKYCFASMFSNEVITQIRQANLNHFEIGLSVGVQKMVRSDLGASGIAFSLNTNNQLNDLVHINGCYGLGEILMKGHVSPDEFIVYNSTLDRNKDKSSIIGKKLGKKIQKLVCSSCTFEKTINVPVSQQNQEKFCLTDKMILNLASWVVKIREYYSKIMGCWCHVDIEWAYDGLAGQLYIVQAKT